MVVKREDFECITEYFEAISYRNFNGKWVTNLKCEPAIQDMYEEWLEEEAIHWKEWLKWVDEKEKENKL